MKRAFLFLSLLMAVSLACDLSVVVSPDSPAPVPTNTAVPTTVAPTQIPASAIPATPVPNTTPTMPQPSFEGVEVTVDPLSIVLSPALASGVRGNQVPRAEGEDLP